MLSGSLRLRNFKISYPSLAGVAAIVPAPAVPVNLEVASPLTAVEDAAPTAVLEASGVTPPASVPTPEPPAAPTPLSGPIATTISAPLHGEMFVWSVAEGDLGTHAVNDQVMTTLSATYNGAKITSYSVAAGSLPPELAFSTTRAILSGTLRQEGHYVFTIRAVADTAASDATYSLTVR